MIRYIIDDVNKKLSYSFKDTLLGIVYPIWNKTQFIPGDRSGNEYVDAVPNDKKKSIVYWEDHGSTTLFSSARYHRIQTHVRLIIWLNFKLIEDINYDACVREIMNGIPKRIGNQAFFFRTGQQAKTPAIFSRYNYRDGKQYVSPPYDVAAFDFNVRYMSTYCPPVVEKEEDVVLVDELGNQIVDEQDNEIIL